MVEPFQMHGTLSPWSRQAVTETTPAIPAFVPAQRVRSFDHIVGQIRDAIASGGITLKAANPECGSACCACLASAIAWSFRPIGARNQL